MKKKKIANLCEESLFEMGDAVNVQHNQLSSLEEERDGIINGINIIKQNNMESESLLKEAEMLLNSLLLDENLDVLNSQDITEIIKDVKSDNKLSIKRTDSIKTNNNWNGYRDEYKKYIEKNSIDSSVDPFLTALGQGEFKKLSEEINDEFAKKTSIINKIDMSFLAIATALQVTKTLLFPIIASNVGYGEGFDKSARKAHDDKTIKQEERCSKDEFRNKASQKNLEAEWTEILYRKPIYDTTKGSLEIGVNMEGGYHRIHTLGHDPILGWIFGTVNILTDTVTLDSFETYQGMREPIRIVPEKVPIFVLFGRAIEKIREHPLNLPAALAAEKIHLKSDEFTKAGLPVPVLETIAPKLAGNLYKKQYDALCLNRDLKVVGMSVVVSMLIDMVIGLIHAIYYDADKDGTKSMFEVRTRKILLISNTIATTSNMIYATVTSNPRNLDIGGILVTLSHLFCDTRFVANIKKEFIENRIYEKIEEELKAIDKTQDRIFTYEYNNLYGKESDAN